MPNSHRRREHPRPWEQDVEKAVHTLPVPITGADGVALLGLIGTEIAAVVVWCKLSLDAPIPHYKLRLLAVATEYRTRGGTEVGDMAAAALSEALLRIKAAEGNALVHGLVDRRNVASQRLMSASNFVVDPNYPVVDLELEAWMTQITTSGPDEDDE